MLKNKVKKVMWLRDEKYQKKRMLYSKKFLPKAKDTSVWPKQEAHENTVVKTSGQQWCAVWKATVPVYTIQTAGERAAQNGRAQLGAG